ncbi:hypothetical protein CLOM_g20095 [Closterium sp. NIES-68]|nr:hypothetical protein CLOM_g20095 [Closterium sp. NIES-68]GJP85058.1 hypothetical protein CLOP_g15162 [Closterium sp. NIES-67]
MATLLSVPTLVNVGLSFLIPPLGLLLLIPLAIVLNVYHWAALSARWLLLRAPTPLSWRYSSRDKVVVITGASSGIGEYMALEYARKGAALVLAARREQRLRAVADECLRLGAPDVAVQRADVSTEEGCHAVINAAVEHYGRINVLVCNAGTAHPGLFEDADDHSSLRSSMDIDFWGNVWPTVFAMPYLRRSHGQVVVTASVAAYLTYPRQAMYNAAKAAIVQFYDTLRAEVHPEEVAITVAMPGFVKSELTTRADASAHIPWWWPMLSTPEAARIIVRAAELRQRHVIVPFWYSAWLLYRLFATQVMDWAQRVMLLGRAPSRFVKGALAAAVGEEVAVWLFQSVGGMPVKGKGKVG